jgi:transposase
MSPSAKKQTVPKLTREELQQAPREQLIDLVLVLQQQVEELQEQNKQIAVLEAKVAELERRLGLNSSNSSKPPSSDPPKTRQKRKRKKKKRRRRGAQKGHEGHHRALVPIEQVSKVVRLVPKRCERCGGIHLEVDTSQLWRHQVWEAPRVQPDITEYQMHMAICLDCSHSTQAGLPQGVTRECFGSRLQALVATFSGVYHLSKRLIQQLLKDLIGVDISLGAISACEQAVSQALEEPYKQAHEHVQNAEIIYADETGWSEANKRAWIWVAVTGLVTVFKLNTGRGRKAARKLLGLFQGFLVSDRWAPYRVHNGKRQLCWAHLLRRFHGFSELRGRAGKIGRELVSRVGEVFAWYHKVRDGTLLLSTFRRRMVQRKIEIGNLLIEGEMLRVRPMSGTCKRILAEEEHLWTFVDHEGVEPTNNNAERALRKGVLWRKVSYGTQSENGSRFVERIMTAAATCQQQERNVFDYLTEACEARRHGRDAPSLLPSSGQTG